MNIFLNLFIWTYVSFIINSISILSYVRSYSYELNYISLDFEQLRHLNILACSLNNINNTKIALLRY
jgi:hypothetical protein